MSDFLWSIMRQRELETLAQNGLTASKVAEHFGISRNAVLGRAHRTGVRFLNAAAKKPPALRQPRPPRPPRERVGTNRVRAGVAGCPRELRRHALAIWLVGQGRIGGRKPLQVKKAIETLGVSYQSVVRNWQHDEALRAEAQAVADAVLADFITKRSEAAAAKLERAQLAAECRDRHNAPLLAAMTPRHRTICDLFLSGKTLDEVGSIFGVTRERIRQIITVQVSRGLDVGGRLNGKPPPSRARKYNDDELLAFRIEHARQMGLARRLSA